MTATRKAGPGRPLEHDLVQWMRKNTASLRMTIPEMATASGIPQGTVNRQLIQARKKRILRRVYVLEFVDQQKP